MPTLKKQLTDIEIKKKEDFKNELDKFKKSKRKDTNKDTTNKKVDAVSFYQSLSDEEKAQFNAELRKKKVRDSYVEYLRYVYPEYVITPFHALLANILQSVVEKVENNQKVKICLSVPPQHGKLVCDETPVLTNKGWKKHGDLVVGDYVANENGDFVRVKHIFPKYFANRKVSFTNGEEILCHENHEWVVFDRCKHKETIRETKFIEKTFNENNLIGRGHRYRYLLPIKKFLKGEEKELYVNPYVMGAWLGDGNNTKPNICSSKEDKIVLEECAKYYSVGGNTIHKTTGVIYKAYLGLRQDLQKYNMCYCAKRCEKHIPIEYLTSSIKQRLELLAGLIDTDGYVDQKRNRIVFTTADEKLKDTFEELIATFGWRTTTQEYKPTTSSSGIVGKKNYWQIAFNPTIEIPCRIERKQLKHFSKQRKISICGVEEIEPLQGNCIEVEGGVYLVGKTMIPTHNSMTCTETLPSWFIGRNPDLRCIITAYNADVAEKFGDKNRQLVKNFGKDIFGIEISDSQDNKTLWDIKKHQGGMLSAGIMGGLTSNGGALVIVDDPFKNGEEADNPEIREKIYRTFSDSVYTRARGKGNAIIVIHTRWHEDDLIGRLSKLGGWIIINIPCVWESGIDKLLHRKIGQTLCPELGFDTEWAETTEKILGARKWNALYQGKPFIDGGNLIKRSDLRFYSKQTKPSVFEEITLSADLSFGGKKSNNDPCCLGVFGRVGADHYLIERVKKKLSFTETLDAIRLLCGKYPMMKKKIIERKANGQATVEVLNREIGGFIEFDPGAKSKIERFNLITPYIEAGNLYLPDESLCPDIEQDIDELLRFPNATHDDFVDIISQYLLNYEYKYGGRISTDSVYSTLSKAIRGLKV